MMHEVSSLLYLLNPSINNENINRGRLNYCIMENRHSCIACNTLLALETRRGCSKIIYLSLSLGINFSFTFCVSFYTKLPREESFLPKKITIKILSITGNLLPSLWYYEVSIIVSHKKFLLKRLNLHFSFLQLIMEFSLFAKIYTSSWTHNDFSLSFDLHVKSNVEALMWYEMACGNFF